MLEGMCEVTMPFLGRAHWVSGCRKSSSSLSHLLSQGPKQRRAPPSHKRGATDPGWQAPRQVADGKVGRQAGGQAGRQAQQKLNWTHLLLKRTYISGMGRHAP